MTKLSLSLSLKHAKHNKSRLKRNTINLMNKPLARHVAERQIIDAEDHDPIALCFQLLHKPPAPTHRLDDAPTRDAKVLVCNIVVESSNLFHDAAVWAHGLQIVESLMHCVELWVVHCTLQAAVAAQFGKRRAWKAEYDPVWTPCNPALPVVEMAKRSARSSSLDVVEQAAACNMREQMGASNAQPMLCQRIRVRCQLGCCACSKNLFRLIYHSNIHSRTHHKQEHSEHDITMCE